MTGVNSLLEVFGDKLTITPKGFSGFLSKGLKGTKTIPFTSITAIQFKKSGFLNGYLQFTMPGGVESRGGILAASSDENTLMFSGQNDLAIEIKDYIEKRIQELRSPSSATASGGVADELQKLAALQSSGILSEDEFIAAKKKLLG